jgi:hypothetical protein
VGTGILERNRFEGQNCYLTFFFYKNKASPFEGTGSCERIRFIFKSPDCTTYWGPSVYGDVSDELKKKPTSKAIGK